MSMAGSSRLTALTKGANLRDSVAAALRAAIIAGEMQPGVVYSAPTLCTKFGVSATPVREAMLDLTKEGLVTAVPNKGFRVTEISDTDLDHITELRLLIEPPTIRTITPHIPDHDFPHLHTLATNIVTAAATNNLIDYIHADHTFHLHLLNYSHNPHLVHTIATLRTQTRLYGLHHLAHQGTLTDSAEEHLTLLTTLQNRDARTAERLTRQHIAHVRGKWAGDGRQREPSDVTPSTGT